MADLRAVDLANVRITPVADIGQKCIRAKGYTDNVVDLLVRKLSRLPVETKETLQLLACMGNSAELARLEMVSQLCLP